MEPKDYALRRLIWAVPTLFFISIVLFVLTRMAGSPIAMYTSRYVTEKKAEALRELYHLNDPIWVQYFYWLKGVFQGDLGWSPTAGQPVTQALLARLPATIELALAGILVALVVSFVLGTLAGKHQDSWIDHITRMLAVAGVSTPQFWSALILVYLFFVVLGWFPLGRATPSIWRSIPHPTGLYTVDALLALDLQAFVDAVWHLVLPSLVLGYTNSAVIMRHLRSEIIEKKTEEYVKAARARGVKNDVIFRRHIRRNSLIPTLTVAGLSLAFLLRGAILAEIVFAWPGLGKFVANAATANDFASLMGFTLLTTVAVMTVNLSVDVLYAYLDPRVELGE